MYIDTIRTLLTDHMTFKLPARSNTFASVAVLAFTVGLAGCGAEIVENTPPIIVLDLPTPSRTIGETTSSSTSQPLPAATQDFAQPVEVSDTPDHSTAQVPEPVLEEESEWNLITQVEVFDLNRDLHLVETANLLLERNQIAQVRSIVNLISVDQLTPSERVDLDLVQVRLLQADARHKAALRRLQGIENNPLLTAEQRLRATRLKVYSASHLDEPMPVIHELVRLYGLYPAGSERLKIGHLLWAALGSMSVDDLAKALTQSAMPDAQPWIRLALSTNLVRHDPNLLNNALDNWMDNHPDHPAIQLIRSGIYSELAFHSKAIALLPLSSRSGRAAQAFLDGLTAQYFADTTPDKPVLEYIDIGDNPSQVTQYYYQALLNGAELIIGPLGIQFVEEIARYGDFVVPTLLLGNVDSSQLPGDVYQFSLAPEHDGAAVARRARQDGHTTALILESSSNWSKRATDAFREKWEELGGEVIQSVTFDQAQSDYSETIKELLNINESVARYRRLRDLLTTSMKYIPRRRQDVDIIFLSADPMQGRLIKPHIDFLNAYDIPVYSTSHIFSGKVDKISDQDLNGVRFLDMNWLIDDSGTADNLRQKLSPDLPVPDELSRIFAMGVDTYNLISRLDLLRDDPDALYHGITSTISIDENSRVVLNRIWAEIADGTPRLITSLPDPEISAIPTNLVPPALPAPLQR